MHKHCLTVKPNHVYGANLISYNLTYNSHSANMEFTRIIHTDTYRYSCIWYDSCMHAYVYFFFTSRWDQFSHLIEVSITAHKFPVPRTHLLYTIFNYHFNFCKLRRSCKYKTSLYKYKIYIYSINNNCAVGNGIYLFIQSCISTMYYNMVNILLNRSFFLSPTFSLSQKLCKNINQCI